MLFAAGAGLLLAAAELAAGAFFALGGGVRLEVVAVLATFLRTARDALDDVLAGDDALGILVAGELPDFRAGVRAAGADTLSFFFSDVAVAAIVTANGSAAALGFEESAAVFFTAVVCTGAGAGAATAPSVGPSLPAVTLSMLGGEATAAAAAAAEG